MRNFPHQVNAIPKLVRALGVASDLIAGDQDVLSDSVYGYALARAGVYTFRGLQDPTPRQLEAKIADEQTKIPGNQGARTFARDIRRTLTLLGFMQMEDGGSLQLSAAGERLVDLPPQPEGEARNLWINALLAIEMNDQQDLSRLHPARTILRIVERWPGVEKKWLAFALDMESESAAEYDRVLGLIDAGDFDQACEVSEASVYEAANAVKVIPALLQQTGLMNIEGGSCEITADGRSLLDGRPLAAAIALAEAQPQARQRRVPRREYIVRGEHEVPVPARIPGQPRTPEEQLHSAGLLTERTTEHQALVRFIVGHLTRVGEIRCTDDAFDILALPVDPATMLLFEVKTVRRDALAQARHAVGQLLFYEFFDVAPRAEGRAIRKIVVFDDEPGDDCRGFLAQCNVLCIVVLQQVLANVPAELGQFFRP